MKKLLLILGVGLLLLSGCKKRIEKIDVNDREVQTLYKAVNPSSDAIIIRSLYDSVNGFKNEYIIAVGLKNYIDNQTEDVQVIDKKDVQDSIKDIFGDIEYKHEDTYLFSDNYCGFKYQDDKYQLIMGCDGDMDSKYFRKLKEAKKISDKIEIYEYVLYGNWDEDYKEFSLYNNHTDLKFIAKVNDDQINIDDYLDKASVYKYTFTNNIFTSIEKIS